MATAPLFGFLDLLTAFNDRVETVGVDLVNAATQATLAEHNRQMDAVTSLFVTRTTDFKTRYRSAAAARLQPLDDNGRARPISLAGHYDLGFPIQSAGGAWGANFRARAKMTVAEVNTVLSTILTADRRWMRDHIFAALFDNVGWTFDDEEHGDLAIKGLANSDTVEYLIQAGADVGATDTHYLATADAIADAADPFPAIYEELVEHPENDGDVIVFVPTNLKSATQALASFVPENDPRLRVGSAITELIAQPGLSNVPGDFLGYHDAKLWVFEWRALPSGYIVATTTGGERPVAMREEPEASLQGFGARAERDDFPFWEAQYTRYAGFGAWNRVGAVVQRIGNGTYAVPSGYAAPMS
jgi:hypothetical protein